MEFRRLSEVEQLTEVPENATVLAEVNGTIKRIPGEGLGGAAGIPTAIIKDNYYDMAVSGVSTMVSSDPEQVYECVNMTFEEAWAILESGNQLDMYIMEGYSMGVPVIVKPDAIMFNKVYDHSAAPQSMKMATFGAISGITVPYIAIAYCCYENALYWTAEGLSTTAPDDSGR